MAVDRSLRTLELLLEKYRADVDARADALAKALAHEQRAIAATSAAEMHTRTAHAALEAARNEQRSNTQTATTADALQWGRRFIERRSDELAIAKTAESKARSALDEARTIVERARTALGEARGKVEAITKRIAAAKKAAADRVEAVAEEEAADRWRRS
ncbi:MAG: hypothetical protein JNK05_20105 [Myxococcales bacterium]|nr:hypothetical protein [Myxococcales bacterium]